MVYIFLIMKLMAIRFSKASMISSGEDGSWKPASNDRFQASDALELVNSNLFCSLRTTPEFLDSNDLIERCLVESCAALYEKEQIYKFQASNWSFIKKERCQVGIQIAQTLWWTYSEHCSQEYVVDRGMSRGPVPPQLEPGPPICQGRSWDHGASHVSPNSADQLSCQDM